MKIKSLIIVIVLLLSCLTADIEDTVVSPLIGEDGSFEVTPEFREFFYREPVEFIEVKNLVEDYGVNNRDELDDSVILNRAISDLSKRGGKIILPKGRYFLDSITLLSNVHLEIEEGTILLPTQLDVKRNQRIFELGRSSRKTVKNVSVTGIGSGFTVDFTQNSNNRLVLFDIQNVSNFKLSNFNIEDNQTVFASILMNLSSNNGHVGWSKNGIIENIHQSNAHIGYGLVQFYATENILFNNISCEGGVTLRLETDNLTMKKVKKGGVDDIYAKDVKGINGLAPVMVSPHFMPNGSFYIDGVYAESCAFAIRLERGYVEIFGDKGQSKQEVASIVESRIGQGSVEVTYLRGAGSRFASRIKPEFSEKTYREYGFRPGLFKKSYITNVSVKRGDNAHFKTPFLPYLPNDLRAYVTNIKGNIRKGSSIAAVYDSAKGEGVGMYDVEISNLTIEGFKDNQHITIYRDTPMLSN